MAKYTVDLRFVFLERELWALGEFLEVIDPQVTFLCDQDRVRTDARLSEQGYLWDDPDLQLELQNLDDRARTIFPRLLRNPFLVILWAAFESGIPQIARDLARTVKTQRRLRDKRGANFLDGATKYFTEILGTPLDPDDNRLARLGDLVVLRNVIAHANGERRTISTEKWKRVEKVVARNPSLGVHDGYLIVSAEYLTSAYHDVDGSLRDLIARVRGPAIRRT